MYALQALHTYVKMQLLSTSSTVVCLPFSFMQLCEVKCTRSIEKKKPGHLVNFGHLIGPETQSLLFVAS